MRAREADCARSEALRRWCGECLKLGMQWVHLRECLICGHVGCCDSSVGKLATRHFGHTRHPVMKSVEPRENWGWCYVDEKMLDL